MIQSKVPGGVYVNKGITHIPADRSATSEGAGLVTTVSGIRIIYAIQMSDLSFKFQIKN